MTNVKTLSRYLLPIIILSLLQTLASFFTTRVFSLLAAMGTSSIAANSVASSIISWMVVLPSVIPLLGCLITAVEAESGKVRQARQLHQSLLFAFLGLLFLACLVLFAFGSRLTVALGVSAEIVAVATEILRGYATAVLVLVVLAYLLGQVILKEHSMTATLLISGGLLAIGIVLQLVLAQSAGLYGFGFADGVQFAACRVFPFVLIPVSAFSSSFGSAQAELTERAVEPKSYIDQYREKQRG